MPAQNKFRFIRRVAVILGAASLVAGGARAGNDIYFVTYNHHIARGELELMIMNDFTAPSKFKREDDGQHSYFSNMIELEYGVTEQFATEFMLEAYEEPATGMNKFTGFRWENRYRLFREPVPLNPVLYAEYEDLDPATRYKMEVSGWINPPYKKDESDEPERERILESRLILSEDFGPMNVAFDWINETDLNGSGTAFGYACGVRYDVNHGHYAHEATPPHAPHHEGGGKQKGMPVSIGLELYGALGDTQKFALRPSRQEHYLQPVIMVHLSENIMFHLALAIGLSKASDDLVRTSLGVEF